MKIIDQLLISDEPSVKYRTRILLLKENPDSANNLKLREEIRNSSRVRKLLSHRNPSGKSAPYDKPYHKWFGAHWVLVHLAELFYPAGDKSLFPLRDQVYDIWLSDYMLNSEDCTDKKSAYGTVAVPVINGRYRRCASQQGNALFATLTLRIEDERSETLKNLLLKWQWPDGGWNCDKNPDARKSSFTESLIPLRALAYCLKKCHEGKVKNAVKNAAEIFLGRNLFKKIRDGKIINPEFLKLHYPCYWHYDILFGLKVMAEAGFIKDSRCSEALDILESKRLKSGGWKTGSKYYKISKYDGFKPELNFERVDWSSKQKSDLTNGLQLMLFMCFQNQEE